MLFHRIAIAPASEPVSLADMRTWLGNNNVDDTVRDSVLTSRLLSARRYAEAFTRRALITQTWDSYADAFLHEFKVKADLQTVSWVKYTDTDGVVQTMDVEEYQVDVVRHRVLPGYDTCWPSTRCVPNAVQLRYVCGYGAASAVPEEIKEAIKFIVGHWEEYQGGIEGGMAITRVPYAVQDLLMMHRDMRGEF